jgi:hypothetical protein
MTMMMVMVMMTTGIWNVVKGTRYEEDRENVSFMKAVFIAAQ